MTQKNNEHDYYLRNTTFVPVFYRGNKIWVLLRVRYELNQILIHVRLRNILHNMLFIEMVFVLYLLHL